MVPRSAVSHYESQVRITKVAQGATRRLWKRMRGRRWSNAWATDVGPKIVAVIGAAQAAAAAGSDRYAAAVLKELDIPVNVPTSLTPSVFAGAAGDGRQISTLAYGAVTTTVHSFYGQPDQTQPTALTAALAQGETYILGLVASILADTARAAEVASIAQRPWITGTIRMIEPGACSRCAVLAGKFYLISDGFRRHPHCRCVHVPYAENAPEDLRTNPNLYFDSLSPRQQDSVFTKAGAEAIRSGADISQVVNARRGMTTAQQNPAGWIAKGRMIPTDVFGKPTYVTTEGTTKRGVARAAMGAGRPVRLMPESIMTLATSPADRVRLLKLYGYIT